MEEQEKDAIEMLAFAYLQTGFAERAASILAALEAVAPGRRSVLKALALAQLRSGQPAPAIDVLDRIALFGLPDSALHLLRARALSACGRQVEAQAATRAFLASREAAQSQGEHA